MNSTYLNINGIPAKLYFTENPHGAVIAIHGFGGSKESRAIEALAERVCVEGLAVLAFDLPAHGEREGGARQLIPQNCIADIISVEQYIRENFSGELYAFATSYGALCLLHRIEQQSDNYRQIVLRVPAVNMAQSLLAICRLKKPDFTVEMAKEQGFCVTLGREYTIPYELYEGLKGMSCLRRSDRWNSGRILAIHASCDELVAPEDTAEFLRCN